MLTKLQAERIANAIQLLQPNWTIPQLMGVMADPRIKNRPPADIASCLAFLATDGETKQPTRAFEPGIWWSTASVRAEHQGPTYRYADPRDCGTCNKPEAECLKDGHDYTPAFVRRDDRATPDLIARVRQAAIDHHQPLKRLDEKENTDE